MAKKYLVNFGDSWAHAVSITRGCGYASLMARKLNRKLLDYSSPSTSIAHMIIQLRNFLTESYVPTKDYAALFFITAKERQLFFDDTGVMFETDCFKNKEQYYKYFYTDELGQFNLNSHIITLQTICKEYNINDQYILGWQYPELWPEVNKRKFYMDAEKNAIEILSKKKLESTNDVYAFLGSGHPCLISKDDGHPSELGHQRIADEWLAHIIRQQLIPQ